MASIFSLLGTSPLFAEESRSPLPEKAVRTQVFFDARETSFNKDTKRQMLEGDVVAIGGGVVLAADQILYDPKTQTIEGKGHIVIMASGNPGDSPTGQIFLGDSLAYHMDTGDFRLNNAVMFVNDSREISETMGRLLGFTPAEFYFEAQRKARLGEIALEKGRLLGEALRSSQGGEQSPSQSLLERYTVLVEEDRLVRTQQNSKLANLSPERREAIEKRRRFWEESRTSAVGFKTAVLNTGYFRISGDVIERVNENDYKAENALLSPCLCERDESPAWGFRADRIFTQLGGYANLKHAVLEIKGIPILYLPRVVLPLKDKRQSGFLLPTFGFQPRSGSIYTQPVYFDLSPSADATVTTDIFENRGTRVGLELRSQQRQYSGWELRAEGIRDRLWLRDRATRMEMSGLYREGLDEALEAKTGFMDSDSGTAKNLDQWEGRLKDPSFWRDTVLGGTELTSENYPNARAAIGQSLIVPENAWRGQYGWRGVTFLAPRLSLVSNGEIVSDHRYLEELYAPNDYYAAFLGGVNAKAFSPAKAQLHLDGKDFYAGFGVRYGDNHILNERFEGQEIPNHFKIQSRFFSLIPEKSLPTAKFPVYAQVLGEHIRITENGSRLERGPLGATPSLGDGSWRRLKISEIAPLSADSIVQVNQFADAETRQIEHKGLGSNRSDLSSWRTGIEFRLPIDGKGALPQWMQGFAQPGATVGLGDGRSYVHHLMDFRLRFSARPSVVKNGLYTNDTKDPTLGRLAYFASDRVVDPNSPIDSDVPEEERMKIHRRVSLSTDHVWKLFRRRLNLNLPAISPDGAVENSALQPSDPMEEARRDLLDAWMRGKSSASFSEDDPWVRANEDSTDGRYRFQDEYYETPLTLKANIAYDFLDAETRTRQRQAQTRLDQEIEDLSASPGVDPARLGSLRDERRGLRLAEPWKNPSAELGLSYLGSRLTALANYSIYLKTTTAFTASFSPPSFFSTNVSAGYGIGKEYLQREGDFRVTRERSFAIASSLIPRVTTNISLTRKVIDGQLSDYTTTVREAAGFSYGSPSQCWGLQFLREKDFAVDEANARYLLQLTGIFQGQQRGLPNMSPSVIRQIAQKNQNVSGVPR